MAFPVDYKYKAKLTIVTRPSSTLTDFPVLLNKDNLPGDIMDANGARRALEDGGDIRFSSDSAGATQLPCDIQQFEQQDNPADAKVEIFVKVPSISSSADTDFYVWWGGPDTTQPADTDTYGAEAVWDSNYKGVWHLTEGWGTGASRFKDATASNKHGTGSFVNGTPTMTAPAGKWGGKCIRCSDSASHSKTYKIAVNGGSPLNYNIRGSTVEAWVQWKSSQSGWFMGKGNAVDTSNWGMRGLGLATDGDSKIWWNRTGGDSSVKSSGTVSADTWAHVAAVTASDGSLTLYIDGSASGTFSAGTIASENGTDPLNLGTGAGGDADAIQEGHNGNLDEVRVHNTARSSAWIAATYNTTNNPATYITEGTTQQVISGTGIATGEAFGTAKVNRGIVGTGIISQETFGTLTVQRGNVNISGAGAIASSQALGSPQVNMTINGIGKILAEEAWSTPRIRMAVVVNGIVSGEAFGTAQLNQGIVGTGIASQEAFGTAQLNQGIVGTGIATAEAFGNACIQLRVWDAGAIPTAEAFGVCKLSYGVEPYGIPTAETFGTAHIKVVILVIGIPSLEVVGEPVVGNLMRPSGIPSGEVFGTAVLTTGNVFITPVNITSEEVFGSPSVRRLVYGQGIPTGETLGAPSVGLTAHPSAISSGEAFGIIIIGLRLQPPGIATGEAFGAVKVNIILSPSGIGSGEAFGTAVLKVVLIPVNITSEEVFGLPVIVSTISTTGILTEEAFGAPQLNCTIFINGINTEEWFGTPGFIGIQHITEAGAIPGTESFGQAIVFFDQIIDMDTSGIPSGEVFGSPVLAVIRQNTFFDYVQNDLEQGMLNTSEFGETGIYIYSNGSLFTLPGIFDHEYVTVDPDTGVGVMNSHPVFWCSTRQFKTKPGIRDKMRIRGVNYQVMRHEPDGTGMSMLFLHQEKSV